MNSSGAKMLSIIDLFTERRPVWTADEICSQLEVSTSTGYRYIRELTSAGLLIRITGGAYVLGGRIVQLEMLMRSIDPISRLGRAIILPMVKQTGCDALLSNIYGEQVINVLHERGTELLDLTFIRGRPLPLFKGATSKAILPFLPRSRVARLYDAHAAEIAAAGMGTSWKEFWRTLQAIREQGYSESRGELDPDIVGFGAPVFNGNEVLGSVVLASSRGRMGVLNQTTLVDLLKSAARDISTAIEGISHPQTAVMALNRKTLRKLSAAAEATNG
jgi:DNA-binding IclR family transcriptional regulator